MHRGALARHRDRHLLGPNGGVPATGRRSWDPIAMGRPRRAIGSVLAGRRSENPLAARSRTRICRPGGLERLAGALPPRRQRVGGRRARRGHGQRRAGKSAFPPSITSTISSDDGPRCVPADPRGTGFLVGAGGRAAMRRAGQRQTAFGFATCSKTSKRPTVILAPAAAPIVEVGQIADQRGRRRRGRACRAVARRRQDVVEGHQRGGQLLVADRGHDRRRAARGVRHAIERRLDRSRERRGAISISLRRPRTDGQRGQSAGARRSRVCVGQLRRRRAVGQDRLRPKPRPSGTATT